MKLLFVVDSFRGGAGNVIQLLAQAFYRRKYEVSILLLNGKLVDPRYDMCGTEIIDYPLGKYAKGYTPFDRVLKSVKVIREQLERIQPDVIVSFLTELNILCCMAHKKKRPLIISERNDPAKDRIKKYWKVLRSRYYRFADRIVVQCAGFRGFSGGRFIDKCSVIPNPVLEPKVTRPAGTIHTPLRLVSLGRLSKQKNFKWMIDSMELLKKYDSDFTLSIYGSGSEENELRSYIEQKQLRDNVFLKGFVADTYSVLAGSDIYLMTSDYEGFPNALSEAMAVGLPAVSRLCHEGIKSLIDNGKNGFVTALDDMQSFVENIIRLKNDPELYSFIGNNAKTISDKYNTDKIALLWEKEITDSLNRAV